MRFYLGTHQPHWVYHMTGVPLFISRRRLCRQKTWKAGATRWALDSGGFSELSMYGRWTVTPQQYAGEVRQWSEQIGGLDWAAIQDWMCEPFVTAKTFPTMPHQLAVQWHQALTVESFGELRAIAPDMPWAPVLQGWHLRDYLRHVEIYDKAGFDLRQCSVVGVGSVCRREDTHSAHAIMAHLAALGLKLHGFGVKTSGVKQYHSHLTSADSMAWSDAARRRPVRLPGCTHQTCANCPKWALRWRQGVLDGLSDRPCAWQPDLLLTGRMA